MGLPVQSWAKEWSLGCVNSRPEGVSLGTTLLPSPVHNTMSCNSCGVTCILHTRQPFPLKQHFNRASHSASTNSQIKRPENKGQFLPLDALMTFSRTLYIFWGCNRSHLTLKPFPPAPVTATEAPPLNDLSAISSRPNTNIFPSAVKAASLVSAPARAGEKQI